MRPASLALLALAPLVTAFVAGCGFDDPPMKTSSVHLARPDGTKAVRLEVRMVGGSVKVRGAGVPLVDGDLSFNRDPYEPTIEQRTDAATERVELGQRGSGFFGRSRNEWDVRVANDLPAAFGIQIGAGAADVDLAGIRLAEFAATVDSGFLSADFSHAKIEGTITASVQVGTGELRVRLPTGVAIRLRGMEHVGDVTVRGVPQVKGEKTIWQTDDFETAATKLDIGFRVGIGQATFER